MYLNRVYVGIIFYSKSVAYFLCFYLIAFEQSCYVNKILQRRLSVYIIIYVCIYVFVRRKVWRAGCIFSETLSMGSRGRHLTHNTPNYYCSKKLLFFNVVYIILYYMLIRISYR